MSNSSSTPLIKKDESERVKAILNNVSADGLRGFVPDALTEHTALRE